MRHQFSQLVAVGAVNGNAATLSDKADNIVARNRLTAAGDMVHQVAHPSTTTRPLSLAGALRRMAFLRQLAQRFAIFLLRARLIQLRLQEINHLIKTNITAANRRQQLVKRGDVIARQQQLFRLFQADIQLIQLVIQNLTASGDILVAILLAEPGVDLGASPAGGDVAQIRFSQSRLGFGCFW